MLTQFTSARNFTVIGRYFHRSFGRGWTRGVDEDRSSKSHYRGIMGGVGCTQRGGGGGAMGVRRECVAG